MWCRVAEFCLYMVLEAFSGWLPGGLVNKDISSTQVADRFITTVIYTVFYLMLGDNAHY